MSISSDSSAPSPTPVDPGIRTLVQVAFAVNDIEKSSAQWAAVLGMPMPEIIITDPGNERGMKYRGVPSNAQAKLSFFHVGQVAIELIEPIGDDSAWAEGLKQNGEGLHHLGFWVENPTEMTQRMEALDLPLIQKAKLADNHGSYGYFDSQEKLGTMIEYLYKGDGPPPADNA